MPGTKSDAAGDDDVRAALANLELFELLTPEHQKELVAKAVVGRVRRTEVLYRQGDPATDVVVVATGRFRIERAAGTTTRVLRELGKGEPIGELGALTGRARTATVRASRDSTIVRVDAGALVEALTSSPAAAAAMLRIVADRAARPEANDNSPPAVIAVLAGQDDAIAQASVIAALVEGYRRQGVPTRAVPSATPEELEAAERDGLVSVLTGTAESPPPLANADVVLVAVAGGRRPPLGGAAASALAARPDRASPHAELVVDHRGELRPGASHWLPVTGAERVHQLRAGSDEDRDRLIRHLRRRSIGVVLSGGGARAAAHLGAVRAIKAAGIPIDHIGGTSMGAVMAAQLATGADPDALIERNRRVLQAAAWGNKFTLPLLSLLSVRTAVPAFEQLFADHDLADGLIPCFVTTVDFTDCVLAIHDRGPAARWARASASPPGLWPPVVDDDGHLHVDGGVLDNLPVGVMRLRGADKVIAVNASTAPRLAVAPGAPEARSWREALARRRAEPPYPTVLDLLFRMGIVSSLPAQANAAADADLYLVPDVSQHGLADYAAFDEIVAAGTSVAQAALAARTDELASWL